MQEFDLEIKDKKGCENHVADHLLRLTIDEVTTQGLDIQEEFPDEKLLLITERPWFAEMANFKAAGVIPDDYSWQQKKISKAAGVIPDDYAWAKMALHRNKKGRTQTSLLLSPKP